MHLVYRHGLATWKINSSTIWNIFYKGFSNPTGTTSMKLFFKIAPLSDNLKCMSSCVDICPGVLVVTNLLRLAPKLRSQVPVSAGSPFGGWPGRFINVRRCGGLHMGLLHLKDPLGFLWRGGTLFYFPGSRFLSLRDVTYAAVTSLLPRVQFRCWWVNVKCKVFEHVHVHRQPLYLRQPAPFPRLWHLCAALLLSLQAADPKTFTEEQLAGELSWGP